MKRTIRPNSRPARHRRGVTLVEMLVTVAMLVIIMTILVQVFQAATGALSAAQTIQQLDDQLKLLDATIRSDLSGATARFTPPLDPAQNLGYFEYGENEFADSQGEDSDDYVRFTAQAPSGRPFTGRMWVTAPAPATSNPEGAYFYNSTAQPVTVTSEYAEIIYFLRNGNLYRRVFLVAPELQPAIVPALSVSPNNLNTGFLLNPKTPTVTSPTLTTTFAPGAFSGNTISWQGVNDLSAHPAATGPSTTTLSTIAVGQQEGTQATQTIVLNTLGNLTNRENRMFYSRFANDFVTLNSSTGGFTAGPDGLADDTNSDNVPDLYPSLYPGVFNPTNGGKQLLFPPPFAPNLTSGVQAILANIANGPSLMAFPFVFPGAYSQAQALTSGSQCGWIHAPSPYALVPASGSVSTVTFDGNPTAYLQYMNHNPLDIGDNLPTLSLAQTETLKGNETAANMTQTWWGFPTWRETLSPNWTDPTVQVNVGPVSLAASSAATAPSTMGSASPQQPTGLAPLTTAEISQGKVNTARPLLPAMTSLWRTTPQLFTDGAGDPSSNGTNTFFNLSTAPGTGALWSNLSWEDDLIMTGVRSFDVKAYDNALGGYGDLGWGDDLRLWGPYANMTGSYVNPNNTASYIAATPSVPLLWPPLSPGGTLYSPLATMAHEGRMPPLVEDNRLDYQNPNPLYVNYSNFVAQYLAAFPNYSSNVGDDNAGLVRLRRVWDTWSTEYSNAPATGVDNVGNPVGPPFSPPIIPSYPPPYPAPLRGIQIQIRVADPSSQRVKSITIRQDFTDKL